MRTKLISDCLLAPEFSSPWTVLVVTSLTGTAFLLLLLLLPVCHLAEKLFMTPSTLSASTPLPVLAPSGCKLSTQVAAIFLIVDTWNQTRIYLRNAGLGKINCQFKSMFCHLYFGWPTDLRNFPQTTGSVSSLVIPSSFMATRRWRGRWGNWQPWRSIHQHQVARLPNFWLNLLHIHGSRHQLYWQTTIHSFCMPERGFADTQTCLRKVLWA